MALPAHSFLSHLQFFKVGKKMALKYGHLMTPGAFPDKVTLDIHFTDAVVQCDVPVVLNTFVGIGDLQMIANTF